jgi:hypothetical protein
MINFDHYAAAIILSNLLRHENLGEWAQKIEGGVEEGATGTEIFMILRMRMSEFLLSGRGSAAAILLAEELFRQLNLSLS